MSSSAHAITPPEPTVANVVPRNPIESFTPRPLIAHILRTRVCVPGSIFLVEGVDGHIAVGKRHRTIRLLLGDGELCIQALASPDLHGIVESGQIYVGCYVQLNNFELRWADLALGSKEWEDDSSATEAAARQPDAPREMVYLVLKDFISVVGWNTVYSDTVAAQPVIPHSSAGRGSAQKIRFEGAQERDEMEGRSDPLHEGSEHETRDIPETGTRRRVNSSGPASSRQDYIRPWTSTDLTKPLKLTPLRGIPNLPYKQNWMVNVLAVVSSLSPIEPSHLAPYKQKTARLADPSTNKEVLLTIFLDAEEFCPALGSVILLMGVKNHRFDGGCLKKYPSDRPLDGSPWWVEDPWDLEWCDVAGLKAWWERRQKHEGSE